MPTDHFVESAFWNFDAMFVPQQHPARELQDTFYVAGEFAICVRVSTSGKRAPHSAPAQQHTSARN